MIESLGGHERQECRLRLSGVGGTGRCSGFTLIELMIVLAIVSILFGIALRSLREENKDAVVQAEAERLAAVLRQARNRALAEQRAYGVAFNIQNAVGTSGAVLNNWDGGHWYQVLGSDQGKHDSVGGLPVAGVAYANRIGEKFGNFVESVRRSQVGGQRYSLPARRVRFLALSDTDEGTRRNTVDAADGEQWYTSTYPRPWFGYYDDASGKLWAWGGYDPSINDSGFYYEGDDGTISGSTHPSAGPDYTLKEDLNRDGDYSDTVSGVAETLTTSLWDAGDPRALIEADWMDATIMFNAEGKAMYLEWCRGRRGYSTNTTASNVQNAGVADRAKQYSNDFTSSDDYGEGVDHYYTAPELNDSHGLVDNGGAAHFNLHTGGFFITLAPDALVDSNDFGSVEEAMDSIDPAWRVFVGESGAISVARVQRRRSDGFLGSAGWPSSPSVWQSTSRSSTTGVYQNIRKGWLHEAAAASVPERDLTADGDPIIDIVSPKMMTDKIWWTRQ